MPVEQMLLKKKSKAAPQRYRRRLDVPRTIALIRLLLKQQYQQLVQQQQAATHSAAGDAGGGVQRPLLRAFLEVSSIMPTNGSLSTLNQGYSIGAWQAVLLALGFEVCSVHAKQWKKGLGLLKTDKDDSRELAARLYAGVGQCQQHIIGRKKDHGRAEALLIAAWGCGWSAEQPRNNGSSSSKDGMLHQGPLRDVVQVDGGMHLLASSSRTNGAASGPDTPDTAVEGADLADGAVATAAFVPASAAVKKAQKEAKPSAKAAPRKKKQGAQPAAARPAVAGRDLAVVSTAAGQQSEAGLHAGSNLAKCKKKATPNKRTVAVQGSGCMQLQQINS